MNSKMNILGIDTSTSHGVSVMHTRGQLVGPLGSNIHTSHSEGLMPMVDQLFKQSGLSPLDLTGVACVKGPGSYTGLRIGLATAQGFATVNNIPCVGISSLEVGARSFALSQQDETSTICTILPARKGWIYVQFFKIDGESVIQSSEEQNLEIEALISKIDQPPVFVGTGVQPYREMLKSVFDQDYKEYQPDVELRGKALINMALDKFQKGETLLPAELLPQYLGASQAEINWKKSHPQDG